VGIVHAGIAEVADRPVGSVITVRGKELPLGATVADARAIFESSSVQLIPLLDGQAYAGAVSRDDIAEAADDEPIAGHAASTPPTATASTSVAQALPVLDDAGGRRLVVLAEDGTTYAGLVCVTRDHSRLCIDAECHAG
jgi:CBS domain-containing protein